MFNSSVCKHINKWGKNSGNKNQTKKFLKQKEEEEYMEYEKNNSKDNITKK